MCVCVVNVQGITKYNTGMAINGTCTYIYIALKNTFRKSKFHFQSVQSNNWNGSK